MIAGTKWKEGMLFECYNDKNNEINYTNPDGPTPKHLFLQSIAACTAIDIVAILEKMRASKPDKFEVKVEGDITNEHPKVFSNFKMTYLFYGSTDHEKIKRAVKLSQESYCGISAMAKRIAPFAFNVFVNDEKIL